MIGPLNLVIGAGNLGTAITKILLKLNRNCTSDKPNLSRGSNEVFWANVRRSDVIWVCIGGRHQEAQKNPAAAMLLAKDFPEMLLDRARDGTQICFFSTADLADPEFPGDPNRRQLGLPRTRFAEAKTHLEELVTSSGRAGTSIVRLSTIYGTTRPLDTLPGRLLNMPWPDLPVSLPWNEVTPTPADWAASMLIRGADNSGLFLNRPAVHHVAPIGSISAHQWAHLIMGETRSHKAWAEKIVWDTKRPRVQMLGCNLAIPNDSWVDLWVQHFKREDYQGVH